MSDAYIEFLRSKIPQAEVCGFEPPSDPHPSLFPHQVDIASWMIRGGRRACFANFGLGKTRINLQLASWVAEKTGGRFLIIAPLGVRQEFTLSDGPSMGLTVEYVLVFRKLPSDTSDGYADVPVKKSKAEYTRADWQIDAAGIWRSSGNRLPDAEVLRHMSHPELIELWKAHCAAGIYSHEEHVAVAKSLEEYGHLPETFMLFASLSRNSDVWSDIARMLTLNTKQSAAGREKHVCPLQLDIIKRLITRYTNRGELVFDPFMGIGSVGWQAIKMGRHALGTELNTDYWADSVGYMEMAEREVDVPTLFDLAAAGAVKIGEAV